jgi:Na+/H+ antiporter NhaC
MSVAMPIGLLITGNGNLTQGSGSTAVLWAVLLAIAVAGLMYLFQRLMNLKEVMDIILKGAGGMIPLALLMILAFSLGKTCRTLGTGNYIADIASKFMTSEFVPAVVFASSAFVAFSTGTSFGTFALMIPLAVPLVSSLDANLPLAVSAVLGGGVFGDHCSPISDTTMVASMASACDHIDHVNTQLPYALLSAGLSLILYMIFGFII